MNAFTPIAQSQTDRARLLIEAACGDVERMERDLIGCDSSTDPQGSRGAALESQILEQQAILMNLAAFLLGVPVERFLRSVGI